MPDFSTYEGRQAYRDAHPGVIVDASGASDGARHTGPAGGGGIAQTAPAVNPGGGGGFYQTANGLQTLGSMEQQLRAAGWGGGEDVATAYARTTGGGVTPGGGGGAGDAGGGGGGPAQSGVGGDQQAILDAFKASSGFSLQELAEKKRQFDAQLEWTKQMWANQGLPELQIKQQAQALAQKEFESQSALAQGNLALAQKAQAAQESQFGQTLAEQQRQFGAQQGLEYLKTAASLGGPQDYFQQSNFLRGGAANPNMPAFLGALQNNVGLSAFNAPGGTAPAVQSMTGLAGRLAGSAAPINQQGALNAIGQIGARGGQALGPQALEQLSPDEMALFQSGMKASGFSMPSFLQNYTQSRVGQGAAQAA